MLNSGTGRPAWLPGQSGLEDELQLPQFLGKASWIGGTGAVLSS